MVFSLAPKAIRKLLFPVKRMMVSKRDTMICVVKQLPRVRSADSLSPFPIKIEALGAPPFPTRAAKAETIMMRGMHTPTPVSASAPFSGKTFDKAIAANPEAKPLFHSDRGFQYTSKVFQMKLKEHKIEQSMSRVGHCIDNGPTEGFWGIIKSEMYQMYDITNESSLRFAIKDYIRFYSEKRPQDRYHCKTPLEVRAEALSTATPQQYLIPKNKRIEKYKEKWCA